jgi:hypothetical protein
LPCSSIALTLDFDSSQVVLDESKKRDWATGSLDTPSGRGVNFQVRVPAVEPVLPALAQAGWPLFLKPEQKWHRTGNVHQFLVQDPDGYLVRFSEWIGERLIGGREQT